MMNITIRQMDDDWFHAVIEDGTKRYHFGNTEELAVYRLLLDNPDICEIKTVDDRPPI
jgi:hypothetical protein